jgi:hypothetical protein
MWWEGECWRQLVRFVWNLCSPSIINYSPWHGNPKIPNWKKNSMQHWWWSLDRAGKLNCVRWMLKIEERKENVCWEREKETKGVYVFGIDIWVTGIWNENERVRFVLNCMGEKGAWCVIQIRNMMIMNMITITRIARVVVENANNGIILILIIISRDMIWSAFLI